MISYIEAQKIILSEAKSFGSEVLPLDKVDGRVLAEDIFADRDYPPFNRSAMDGYAIRFEDWEMGLRNYRIQEVVYAGKNPLASLAHGAAFKIMTGAAVPLSANVVIRKEDTIQNDTQVSIILDNIKTYQNIARKGEDLAEGATAIQKNIRCTPAVISTLATLGYGKVRVNSLPTVALFTTGNEVKPVNAPVSNIEIRNSNSYLLKSLLQVWNISPIMYRHLPDDRDELQSALGAALDADIIILSGGVSAGDADYVPEVLENLSVKKLFHKVSIKPGKPIWCGTTPRGSIVFALPGNPFSSLVTFKIFVEPFIQKALGLPELKPFKASLQGRKDKKTPLDEFFPAKFVNSGSQLAPTQLNGSGDIRLGIEADALGMHPSESNLLEDGQLVEYYKL